MKLTINDINEEDRGILSPCGIACIGCDSHTGEGFKAANDLKKIWEGSNILDISSIMHIKIEEIETTFKVLTTFIKSGELGKCPGCFLGAPMSEFCGIAKCVKSKGFWTCAECEDYSIDSETPCPYINPNPIPMADKGRMTRLMCSRYNKDTINNLKKCRDIGYPAFIKELKDKVKNGWRTWHVISNEMVFTEAMKK